MNRIQALELLESHLKNKNLFKHCLAVEAIMVALAEHFNANKEDWALAGLLHDIDYEQTMNDPERHSLIGSDILKENNLTDEIVQAVKTHNEMHGLKPESLMAKSLFVGDPISGLIIAAALVLPSKKLDELRSENIVRRFKEKAFARGASRDIIIQCETLLDLPLEQFCDISLKALQGISNDLGL
jgi:uncharacterized protein